MDEDSDPGRSNVTARNSPAGNVNMIPPIGELREPRVSFSTTSNVSDVSNSTVVTQQDLEACMRRMEERFDTSMERLTRNLVAPSQIDEITSRLDQLSVISPTQPLHGPYRARMGPSMYTRPPLPFGFSYASWISATIRGTFLQYEFPNAHPFPSCPAGSSSGPYGSSGVRGEFKPCAPFPTG